MKADIITFIYSLWQMLSHIFIYYMLQQLKMADVIAKWQMEWPLQGGDW